MLDGTAEVPVRPTAPPPGRTPHASPAPRSSDFTEWPKTALEPASPDRPATSRTEPRRGWRLAILACALLVGALVVLLLLAARACVSG